MAAISVARLPLVQVATQIAPQDDSQYDDEHLEEMLDSRMGWDLRPEKRDEVFRDVLVRRTGEQASIIAVIDKEVLVIKDDLVLFPSDAVVTQLRLLTGSK